MASFRLTCPYCENNERMEFQGPFRMWDANGTLTRERTDARKMVGAVVCPSCSAPVGLRLRSQGSNVLNRVVSTNSPEETDATLSNVSLTTVPSGNPIEINEALPERIRHS